MYSNFRSISTRPVLRIDIDRCGPEGPAAGAKRPHAAEGRAGARSETIVPEATD